MRGYIVSGLAELLTCAAIEELDPSSKGNVVIFFGSTRSIPQRLRDDFLALAPRFGFENIIDACDIGETIAAFVQPTTFEQVKSLVRQEFGHLKFSELYSNCLEKGFVAALVEINSEAELSFYDNGLVSHLDTPIYEGEWRIRRRREGPIARATLARVTRAYYSLLEYLPKPAHLADVPMTSVPAEVLRTVALRAATALRVEMFGGTFAGDFIVGTAFYRTERMTWQEERGVYQRLSAALRYERRIVAYKDHPRAPAGALLTKHDRIIAINPSIPVEVLLAHCAVENAYSISSSAIFSLNKLYGAGMHCVGEHIADDRLPPVVALFRAAVQSAAPDRR